MVQAQPAGPQQLAHKVSEKSLELNVGAEVLQSLRTQGRQKVYLRGLTQREEKQQGIDFFVHLDPRTRILAFQFKAARGRVDAVPYRFTLNRDQHNVLFGLANHWPRSVFYVFPFYVTSWKLHQDVPDLAQDTWVLDVSQMPTAVFGGRQSRIVRCYPGQVKVNPEYPLRSLREVAPTYEGVPKSEFVSWYFRLRDQLSKARNPRLVRSLRVAVVLP